MLALRLKQARLRSGLTLEEVSTRLAGLGVSLTRAALSKYETGKSTPRQALLVQLGRVLGVPASHFLTEPAVAVRWIAFRKTAALPAKRQERLKAAAEEVVERHVLLEDAIAPGRIADFPRPKKVARIEDAEQLAESLRTSWKLGEAPIESITQEIEDHGGIVVVSEDAPDTFDGLSGYANEKFPVLVSSDQPAVDRRRYNLAHELGHVVGDCSQLGTKDEEKFAHRFAAAFLVPAAAARRELGAKRTKISIGELRHLKRKYGLSMQAWARRARDLGVIEAGAYTRLCIEFSRRGWRKSEPDPLTNPEKPARLEMMAMRAVAEGLLPPSRVEELCPECSGAAKASPMRASELRRLSPSQRDDLLQRSAEMAWKDYATDATLTDFEALGDDEPIS